MSLIDKELKTILSQMEQHLILKLYLDETPLSTELRTYMEELAAQSDKLTVQIQEIIKDTGHSEYPSASGKPEEFGVSGKPNGDKSRELPYVQVCRGDGRESGLAFHGVPAENEFAAFVLGLYNAAGQGQELRPEIKKLIDRITYPVNMKILVSLSCNMCPELVTAAQQIAAVNPHVTAEVYDLNHYPDLKQKYQVTSVPCLVINDGSPLFGIKNMEQLLDMI